MHRRAARKRGGSRPQRVVGRGQQQFIAFIQQSIQCHHNQVAGAIAQINVFQRNPFNALLLGVMHDRFACGKNAFAVRVPS